MTLLHVKLLIFKKPLKSARYLFWRLLGCYGQRND